MILILYAGPIPKMLEKSQKIFKKFQIWQNLQEYPKRDENSKKGNIQLPKVEKKLKKEIYNYQKRNKKLKNDGNY
jgi:hypothetical protein